MSQQNTESPDLFGKADSPQTPTPHTEEQIADKQFAQRVALLQQAKDAYYNGDGQLLLTDAEFDRLEDQLRQWAPEHPYFASVGASPASAADVEVAEEAQTAANKIQHKIPMLSMDKAKQVSAVHNWFERLIKHCPEVGPETELCVQPKIDGISASCYYQDGTLVHVATRGDGQYGQNISYLAPMLADIPLELPELYKNQDNQDNNGQVLADFEVRGELFVPKDAKDASMAGDARPLRNICAGLINRKEIQPEDVQEVRFIAYQCPQQRLHPSEFEQILRLQQMGFHTVEARLCNIEDVAAYVETYLEQLRQDWRYETDGLIISIDNSQLFAAIDALWVVNHHHHYTIALKPPAESGLTLLRQVHWQLGRQGRLNPVAEFLPVTLASAVIERATLHNYANVLRLQIQRGDVLEIERAGDVIPYVQRNLGNPAKILQTGGVDNLNCTVASEPDKPQLDQTPLSLAEACKLSRQWIQKQGAEIIPQTCPSCGGPLEQPLQQGADLLCRNRNCPEQVVQRILFWVKQADMDQIAEQSLRQLYQEGKLRQLQDLYRLTRRDFLGMAGYGDKKIYNFLWELENSRHMTVSQFIERLGIPLMQQKSAQKLGRLRRKSRWEAFLAKSYELCPLWEKKQKTEMQSQEQERQQSVLLQTMQTVSKELLADWRPATESELSQDNFCEKLLEELLNNLSNSADEPNEAWACLLRLWGIRVGRSELWKNGFSSWEALLLKAHPYYLDLHYIEDFTAFSEPPSRYSLIESLSRWLAEKQNQILVQELLEVLQIAEPKTEAAAANHGMVTVCMTGSGPLPRKQLQAKLEAAGYKVTDSVSKDTAILLCADPNASSNKLKKASSWGVQILSYDEFLAGLERAE